MREIKFRAWDTVDNEFVNTIGMSLSLLSLNTRYKFTQYTGQKDNSKRKTEIYEGDIIRANIISFSITTMGEIVFDVEHSVYCSKNEGGLTQLQNLNKFEVIGNIYENPELLEKK